MKDITDAGYYYSVGPRYNTEKLKLIPDDLLILEIDVLPRKDFKLPSVVFQEMLETTAKKRGTTPEEIEAINHKNALKLVSDNPFQSDITKLLTQ
jgi:hypothetical protein